MLAAALGCGLLIGIERERRKGSGPGRAPAGVRTFALAALTGAACMLLGQLPLTLVGAAFVAALGVAAYWRNRPDDPGITTEVALLLAYLIGALCYWSLPLAAGLAVTVTGLLAGRERMHHFARQWLQPGEVRDGIVLCALALIAVPLLPDRALWGPVFNPRDIATLLALLLAIQALAHLGGRLLKARQALVLSSLASGFVSSTGAIATLGMRVREGRAGARLMAGAALLTCVATMLQLLVVAAAVQPGWLAVLWLPALAGAGLVTLWGGAMVHHEMMRHERAGAAPAPGAQATGLAAAGGGDGDGDGEGGRMFSLRNAALVAALLTGVQLATHALTLWLGSAGLLTGVLLAALVDLHSAVAAALAQAPLGQAPAGGGAGPVPVAVMGAMVGALTVHGLSKCATAWVSGGRAYALALAPGLLGHTALVVGLLAWRLLAGQAR